MKSNTYYVYFTDGSYLEQKVAVVAMCASDAEILASAERINLGLDRTVDRVELV